MAKIKTVEEIKAEAKRVMQEAKRKQKELLKEAADLKQKTICELGSKCVEFLDGDIDIETLKAFARNNDLIKIKEQKKNQEEENDVVNTDNTSTDTNKSSFDKNYLNEE